MATVKSAGVAAAIAIGSMERLKERAWRLRQRMTPKTPQTMTVSDTVHSASRRPHLSILLSLAMPCDINSNLHI